MKQAQLFRILSNVENGVDINHLEIECSLADHLHGQADMWDMRKRRLNICEDCVDSGCFQNVGNGDDIHHLEIEFGHADHLYAKRACGR